MYPLHSRQKMEARKSGSQSYALTCILSVCLLLLSACGGDSGNGSAFTTGTAVGSNNLLSLSGTVSGLAANS